MGLPADPNTWKNIKDLTKDPQPSVFLNDLTKVINTISSLNYILGLLNMSASLSGGAIAAATIGATKLKYVTTSIGSVGTNQTIDCTDASVVSITIQPSASLTLTLNNLTIGVPVFLRVDNNTGALTLKLAANTPVPAAYQTRFKFSGGAVTDFAATGLVFSTTATFFFSGAGNSIP
jgi:hypothetical protein